MENFFPGNQKAYEGQVHQGFGGFGSLANNASR